MPWENQRLCGKRCPTRSWSQSTRCNNIKILGLTEGEESGRPTEFIAGLLPKLLGANNFAKPVRLDRAHRIPVPKPTDRKRRRSIIARINFFQEKELILRLSRQQLMYNNHRVYIFPSSHTAEVMEQRRGFREVTQVLREREVKYSLRFPAKLHVHYKEQVTVFTSPQDALSFIKQVFSTLFLNLLNLVQTVFGGRPLQGGMWTLFLLRYLWLPLNRWWQIKFVFKYILSSFHCGVTVCSEFFFFFFFPHLHLHWWGFGLSRVSLVTLGGFFSFTLYLFLFIYFVVLFRFGGGVGGMVYVWGEGLGLGFSAQSVCIKHCNKHFIDPFIFLK